MRVATRTKLSKAGIALSVYIIAYMLIDNPYIFGGVFLMQFGNNLTQQKG